MNMKDLKSFLTVYQENSIKQAAKKLFITPQGLSKNIQNLEQELGTVLFERTNQGVQATESAHLLQERAKILLEDYEELKQAIKPAEDQQKLLRIGCANGTLNLIPFSVINTFTKDYPEYRITWAEYPNKTIRELLIQSELDYGFIVGNWPDERMTLQKRYETDLLLLVYEGHPLYSRSQVSLEDLRQEKLISLDEHFQIFHDLTNACQVRGFEPDIVAKTADASSQYKLCIEKVGLTVVPGFMQEMFRMEGVHAIPFSPQMKWEIYGCYKTARESYSAIASFHKYLPD